MTTKADDPLDDKDSVFYSREGTLPAGTAASEVRAALAELVAVKDLKDRVAELLKKHEELQAHWDNEEYDEDAEQAFQAWNEALGEYMERKPLAWAAARAALANTDPGQQGRMQAAAASGSDELKHLCGHHGFNPYEGDGCPACAQQAAAAPEQDGKTCAHEWQIWPETDGQEQRCKLCGSFRKTPEAEKFWE